MSENSPAEPLKICAKCSAQLPAGGTNGLCPACLMAEAMQPTGPKKAWEPPAAEELQKLLSQYEITALLGLGGMGAVYKGTQISLDRPVAIKILSNDLDATDASFAERFKNEARSMAKLKHPGIVGVYDFGETPDGLLYIVMEFIEGTDVAKMISKQGRLHTEHAMAITAHVCDALAYAHERGIIHRDIKPANIMVGYDGVVKVADFGLAKMSHDSRSGLTQSGMAMGTLHYMAPEALMLGTAVDHRADIYAVGVMLYQMLTGKLPQGLFEMPSLQVKGLDPRYDGIISKALRENREVRYSNALAMRLDLDAILTQPVVRVEAAAEKAPAALPTQARPQRPAGQPYRPPPPQVVVHPLKKGSPLLWSALLAMTVAAAWFYFKGTFVIKVDPSDGGSQVNVTSSAEKSAPTALVLSDISKDAPFVNSLGMKFVPVPGTDLLFCIHEVRRKDYATYASAVSGVDASWKTGGTKGIGTEEINDCPVVNVSWNEATAFCQWLSQKEGLTYQLPTTKEWSLAVGKSETESTGNYGLIEGRAPDGYSQTAPVMRFAPNAFGLYDLGGNVWEWCDGPHPDYPNERALRGGSWNNDNPRDSPSKDTNRNTPDARKDIFGFRCVLKAAPPVQTITQLPAPQPVVSRAPAPQPDFTNSLGMKFVKVPGTTVQFCMHETRKQDYAAYATANPAVDGSWRNASFENVPLSTADDHPVINVSWEDATDFCTWLSQKEGRTYRLPTDREWSIAVGLGDIELGDTKPDDAMTAQTWDVYPWGRTWPPPNGSGNFSDTSASKIFPTRDFLATYTDGHATTAPVMSFFPNSIGLYDLAGNVREWCSDIAGWGKTKRVSRGSDYLEHNKTVMLSARRDNTDANTRYHLYGFRCVYAPATSASASAKPVSPPVTASLPASAPAATPSVKSVQPTPAPPPLGPATTTWTDNRGRVITAKFKAIQDDKVVLEIAGNLHPVALNTLSAESQKQALAMEAVRSAGGLGGATSNPPGAGSAPPNVSKLATKDRPLVNSLGMKFVPVPGTDVLFCVHETRRKDYAAYADTTPGVDQTWASHNGYSIPAAEKPDHAVFYVSRFDAQKFCEWLSKKEGRTYRLPTDREWSYAAGIGADESVDTPERLSGKVTGRYPWGNVWPPSNKSGNYADRTYATQYPDAPFIKNYRDGYAVTAPVMSFPPNELGIYDLGGNVWEWCSDSWNPTSTDGVSRGGSWRFYEKDQLLSSYRDQWTPQGRGISTGFRVVLEVPTGVTKPSGKPTVVGSP